MTDRAQPESFRARSIGVSFTANDLQKSLAWYRDVLGFTVDREHVRDGTLFAVSLKAGTEKVLLTQDNGSKGSDRTKGVGFSVQFTTSQDIDALANLIKERGGVLESDPATTPWGVRVFRLVDPDGFKLVISSEQA